VDKLFTFTGTATGGQSRPESAWQCEFSEYVSFRVGIMGYSPSTVAVTNGLVYDRTGWSSYRGWLHGIPELQLFALSCGEHGVT
jgi:hypothetical protein